MSKVIILRGVPGSGKSTWVNQYKLDNRGQWILVCSRDKVRESLFGTAAAHGVDEDEVTRVFNDDFMFCLTEAYNNDIHIIVDNTNCDWNRVAELAHMVKQFDIPVKTVLINTDLNEALRRNAARDRVVPEHVIRRMHAQLMESRDWEL